MFHPDQKLGFVACVIERFSCRTLPICDAIKVRAARHGEPKLSHLSSFLLLLSLFLSFVPLGTYCYYTLIDDERFDRLTRHPATMTSPDPDSASSLPRRSSLPAVEPSSHSQNQLEAQVPLHQASTTEPEAPLYTLSPTVFSDYGSDIDRQSTRSMSIASSSRDYAFENGRRYHKFREGSYALPNDESEQDRENMKHAMIVSLCGGRLHFAPVGKYAEGENGGDLHNVIDLGTGTGIWCMESTSPSCEQRIEVRLRSGMRSASGRIGRIRLLTVDSGRRIPLRSDPGC